MAEHQPLPYHSWRTASKPPLPPKATPRKQSHLTESSTSQTFGSSSELPESPILVSTMTLVTPIIIGTPIGEVEPLQLPEDTKSELSEMITQVVQEEVDSQPKVVQQEITYEPKYIQQEVHPKPITVQPEVTFELQVVQEAQAEPVVLLPEHLDLEVEQSEVVPILEYDQPVYPQTYIIVDTSPLPQSETPKSITELIVKSFHLV